MPRKDAAQRREADRLRLRRWRAANPEKVQAQNHRANRSAKGRAKSRRYVQSHKAQRQELDQRRGPKYRAAHAAELKARLKAWRAAHPEHVRRHRAAVDARRRADKFRTAVGPVNYAAVAAQAHGRCGICRETILPGQKTHFDHIVPLAQGGPHIQSNLQLAHASCNFKKNGKKRHAA